MDFQVLQDTGVSQGEFARLMGVSRVTVNNWCRGHSTPRGDRAKKARQLILVLRRCGEAGMLPDRLDSAKKTDTQTRMRVIKSALSEIIAAIKAEKN